MSGGPRIARFVKAARTLLLAQVVAGVLATVLGVWAVVAVRDLATERDALRARLTELEKGQPVAPAAEAAPQGPAPSPLDTEVRPPAILPIPIPVTQAPSDVPPIEPGPGTPGTGAAPVDPVLSPPTAEPDCTGADANTPRCRRPGRWIRPDGVTRRPDQPVEIPQKQDAPR